MALCYGALAVVLYYYYYYYYITQLLCKSSRGVRLYIRAMQ